MSNSTSASSGKPFITIWLGNTNKPTDDADGFYDRSLGAVTNNASRQALPARRAASNRALAPASTPPGDLDRAYDDAGNLTGLTSTAPARACRGADCDQGFDYHWDEVGTLGRARRFDGARHSRRPTSAITTTPATSAS